MKTINLFSKNLLFIAIFFIATLSSCKKDDCVGCDNEPTCTTCDGRGGNTQTNPTPTCYTCGSGNSNPTNTMVWGAITGQGTVLDDECLHLVSVYIDDTTMIHGYTCDVDLKYYILDHEKIPGVTYATVSLLEATKLGQEYLITGASYSAIGKATEITDEYVAPKEAAKE